MRKIVPVIVPGLLSNGRLPAQGPATRLVARAARLMPITETCGSRGSAHSVEARAPFAGGAPVVRELEMAVR